MVKVLFVDDEANVLNGLRRMLYPMRRKWEMNFVGSGPAALEALESGSYDVIVTDMIMPGMDGAALLDRVIERWPGMVRIVLSGHSDREKALHTVQTAHQFITKPCNAKELCSLIEKATSFPFQNASESLRAAVARIGVLPSLPTLYHEVVFELNTPHTSIHKIGEIIAHDMGMTAKILQLVNSSFFGLPCHISSPGQAAMMLGVEVLKALVIAEHIFSRYERNVAGKVDLAPLWDHSMRVGMGARNIAEAEGLDKKITGMAFMAGMVHDIGILIMAQNLPEDFDHTRMVAEENSGNWVDAEKRVFNATHAEIGAYLLSLWNFEEDIIKAVKYHHEPSKALTSGFTLLTAVHAADAFDHGLDSTLGEKWNPRLDMEYIENIGMNGHWEDWEESFKRQGDCLT